MALAYSLAKVRNKNEIRMIKPYLVVSVSVILEVVRGVITTIVDKEVWLLREAVVVPLQVILDFAHCFESCFEFA